jgi:hypothetical protein
VGAAAVTGFLAVALDLMDSRYAHMSVLHIYRAILKRFWPLLVTYLGIALMVGGGTVLLLFPGIIISIMTMFALPLSVLEDLSFEKAIARSNGLTHGYKWAIFGRLLLYGVIVGVLVIVAGFLMGLLQMISPILSILFVFFTMIILAPSVPVLMATLYKQLSHIHDGEKKSKPLQQWFIILFIILGIAYFVLTNTMNNSTSRKMKMEARIQAVQAQIDAANMTAPADAPLPTAPAVQ